MQKLKAIFTIIRFPNLVFIFLSQIIIYFKVIVPLGLLAQLPTVITNSDIFILALSTTLIAAGGYIINDYFDVKIDEINKPSRVTVELQFRRRHIMFAHIALDIIAVLITIPLALKAGHISLIGIPLISILMLVLYSAYFKRKPLSGNLIVAALTALTVYTPALYEFNIFHRVSMESITIIAIYAFCLTLMREIVKDLEDLKGDEADGCRTFPIVFGINHSKNLLYLLATLFFIFNCYIISFLHYFYQAFFVGLLNIAMIMLVYYLWKANKHIQFKFLSRLLKIITFYGVILLIFYQ
jgi:4-hydroxybenzoate polyprenyltransferase